MATIFTKIIKGEIPCYKVYEDDHTLAFLDIQPHAKGHTLVVPKKEAETIFDLTPVEACELMSAIQKTMEILQEKLNPDGFNVGWNHKQSGGQAVPHVHVHIMPRYKGDGGGSMHSIVNAPVAVEEVVRLL